MVFPSMGLAIGATSQVRNPSEVASPRLRLDSSLCEELLTMNQIGSTLARNESSAVPQRRSAVARPESRRMGIGRGVGSWNVGAEPEREMGPTRRLTPLSPACGPRRTLYAWRLQSCPLGSVSIARRSRRCRFHPGGRSCPEGLVQSHPLVPRSDLRTGPQAVPALPVSIAETSAPGRNTRPFRLRYLAAELSEAWIGPKAILRPVPPPCGPRRRVDPVAVPTFHSGLAAFDPVGTFPRFDDWRMRLLTDSGNSATGQLSTFGSFASGQGWITQRPVAKCTIYPRSRWARSLKRSALSLMKPAASC